MILIVLLLLALFPAASQAQQSASERMAARLRQIASEIRAQVPTNLNTLNMNAASAAYLREQLTNAQNHNRQQALRLELAIQLLRVEPATRNRFRPRRYSSSRRSYLANDWTKAALLQPRHGPDPPHPRGR